MRASHSLRQLSGRAAGGVRGQRVRWILVLKQRRSGGKHVGQKDQLHIRGDVLRFFRRAADKG